VRFSVKSRFLAGLAHRLVEADGVDKLPAVQSMLGELASYSSMAGGLVTASEAECIEDPRGFVYPAPKYIYANGWLQATYYGKMLDTLRELTGAGFLQAPSSYRDYHNAEIAPDLERFIRGPGLASVERAKLFRLAWDLVGSEFAGRHAQYELFYAGSRATTTSIRSYRVYDFADAKKLVERCLASYDLPPAPDAPGHSS